MEANVRAFLVAEFRASAGQETVRRKGEERSRALLETWAGHVGTAAARSVTIAQNIRESRRDAPARAMAADRVLRGTTITGQEDEEKRRTLPGASGKGQKKPHAEAGKAGVTVGRGASTKARAGALASGYQPRWSKSSPTPMALTARPPPPICRPRGRVLETHEGSSSRAERRSTPKSPFGRRTSNSALRAKT